MYLYETLPTANTIKKKKEKKKSNHSKFCSFLLIFLFDSSMCALLYTRPYSFDL